MKIINGSIQWNMDSTYLNMEIEEVVKSISFMAGCKSYMCLNYVRDEFINWKRDATSDKCELKLRGIAWSKMGDELRKIVTNTLRGFLVSDVDNITYFK